MAPTLPALPSAFLLALFLLLFASSPGLALETTSVDDFDYASSAEAQAVWRPMSGVAEAVMASSGVWGEERVMVLPVNMTTEVERNWWDGSIDLDLSQYERFSLEVFVDNPDPISHFTLYFHCPAGWTGRAASISQEGWQVWTWHKGDFINEGPSFDWSQVDRIRLSPWKGSEGPCTLALKRLYTFSPEILIVEGDLDYAKVIEQVMTKWDLPYGYITDASVASDGLGQADLAIFPYNSGMSDAEIDRVDAFTRAGGKVLSFYSIPGRMPDVLGLRRLAWVQAQYPGQFSAYRFNAPEIIGLPERAYQTSWNIYSVLPDAPDARTIAYWEDAQGVQQPYPAWVVSSTGAFMSHVLLSGDYANQERMVLALLGHFRPETWDEAAAVALDRLGVVGEMDEYAEAVAFIEGQAHGGPRDATVTSYLDEAGSLRQTAIEAYSQNRYFDTIQAAMSAQEALLEAYYYCQSPKPGEFRAFWEHSGLGAYPGDWEKSIKNLKDHGFTAVIPNMLWGGEAHYASDLLPRSEEFDQYGDQVAQCVEAAHRYGLEVHVWKVNWKFGSHAPQSWIDAMRAAERTQVDVHGDPVDWLCPSHPDNFALERDTMLEVARKYDVDGVHFDYIRYPDHTCCYCDGCQQRFQQQTGLTVDNWPSDCYSGSLAEAYNDWRIQQITRLVEAVRAGIDQEQLSAKVSAAVFSNYPSCRSSIAQDWVDWIDSSSLDFICPMDYTSDFKYFRQRVSNQHTLVAGRIPFYPGIGATASSSQLSSDGVITQILIARELGAPGYTIFNYSSGLALQLLPDLVKGITAAPRPSGLSVY